MQEGTSGRSWFYSLSTWRSAESLNSFPNTLKYANTHLCTLTFTHRCTSPPTQGTPIDTCRCGYTNTHRNTQANPQEHGGVGAQCTRKPRHAHRHTQVCMHTHTHGNTQARPRRNTCCMDSEEEMNAVFHHPAGGRRSPLLLLETEHRQQ